MKSTTDSGKRKSKDGQTSRKKSKKEEPQNISQLLTNIHSHIVSALNNFSIFQAESWYKELVTRRDAISYLIDIGVESRRDRNFPELTLPFTPPEDNNQLIKVRLDDLRGLCDEAYHLSMVLKSHNLPAPSTYCLPSIYRRLQLDSETAVRDGRTGTMPVALELLHSSFRTFTYWAFSDPYPLPDSRTRSKEKRPIDNDAFITVYKVANMLLHTMPKFFMTHNSRLSSFMDCLRLIFPEDEDYEWVHDMVVDHDVPDNSRFRVDIVYRGKKELIPLIFVEVKLELGEGGNPFWQNHRLYQTYTSRHLNARYNGAPIFFMQLCGMTFVYYDFHISQSLFQERILGLVGGFTTYLTTIHLPLYNN